MLHEANRYLFTDTNAMTTYQFSQYYHGVSLQRLDDLAARCATRYDLVFVCDTDIPYEDTWDRSGNVKRTVFQKRILADLHMRKIPYVLLRGDLQTRTTTVKSVLARHQKFSNPFVSVTSQPEMS